jgi:GNAT superfamily N-acetyltransferase
LPDGFIEVTPVSAAPLVAAMALEGDRVAIRFARGCRAFARFAEGEVVSYGWLSTEREWVGELALDITLAPGEAYVWNCFTLEPHRRRGHYRAVLEGIVAVARSQGLRRLWIGSVDIPAEKADSDAGFARVLRFDISSAGEQRTLTVTAAPGADPGLVEAARLRLGVSGSTHTGPRRDRIH